MKLGFWPAKTKERRATVLAGLILLQGLSALFFVGDVFFDFRDDGHLDDPHLLLEMIAAVALIGGVIFLMIELRRLLSRMSDMQTGLDIAHGHMATIVEEFFDDWNLTRAEKDVAIMILKGLDNDAIARARNTASGTVRAQTTSIYAKSQSDGRAQFISLFVEELIVGNERLGTGAEYGPENEVITDHSPDRNLCKEKT